MNLDLDNDTVADLMQRQLVTIKATDTIVDVAKLFQQHRFHAAPVVDERGVCLGILTSSDVVRFEAQWQSRQTQLQHGTNFDVARYDNENSSSDPYRIDQVGSQMTTSFQAVAGGVSLAKAISLMHDRQLHHLLVLDGLDKPYGILSTMDVLGYLVQKIHKSGSTRSEKGHG